MAITTVKIRDETKSSLDELKSDRESYDDVIAKLVLVSKNKNLNNELIDGYKTVGKNDLKILREWDFASTDV